LLRHRGEHGLFRRARGGNVGEVAASAVVMRIDRRSVSMLPNALAGKP